MQVQLELLAGLFQALTITSQCTFVYTCTLASYTCVQVHKKCIQFNSIQFKYLIE